MWVFNPSIIYSSTRIPESPKQAMKVYYKHLVNPASTLNKEGYKADELRLPGQALTNLNLALQGNSCLLPVRKFQEWHVSLLNR